MKLVNIVVAFLSGGVVEGAGKAGGAGSGVVVVPPRAVPMAGDIRAGAGNRQRPRRPVGLPLLGERWRRPEADVALALWYVASEQVTV